MPRTIFLRVTILLVGLFTTIYSIRYLDNKGVESTALKHLLLQENSEALTKWNWCQGKIKKLSFKHHLKPEKSWEYIFKDNPQEISWLQNNCNIEISKLSNSKRDIGKFDSVLIVEFDDQTRLDLNMQSATGIFGWNQVFYRSYEWLSRFRNLAKNNLKNQ